MHTPDGISRQPNSKGRRGREIAILALLACVPLLLFLWHKSGKRWPVNLPAPLHTLQSGGYVQTLAFSPDSKTLAIGTGGDETCLIELWSTDSAALWHRDSIPERVYVGDVAFSPDGGILAAGFGGYAHPVKLWSAKSGELQQTFSGHRANVDHVDFSADGKSVLSVSAYEDRTIWTWDRRSGQRLSTKKLQGMGTRDEEFIRETAFSPDRKLLAGGVSRYEGGDEMSRLRLWDARSGKLIRGFPEQEEGIFGLVFSPDGKLLASASSDTTITIWDMVAQEPLFQLQGHRSSVTDVAFSGDGRWLISGSGDSLNEEPGEVLVWDIAARKLVKTLTVNDEPVYSVAFSPDGKLMASSHDDRVKLWSTEVLKPW